ncbi:hypothetical protein I4U23_006684 [Adineta vaga]|nr:hypothetical protein I4U23_006684 [Adineta vaga]
MKEKLSDDNKIFWTKQINDRSFEIAELILGGIIPILLIFIGTISNLLCIFCLLCRKHRRIRSTYIYLIFLFLADTFSLYQWNLNDIFMQFNNGTQLTNKSLFLCHSIAFLSFYTLHLSALFLTLVSIDRTLLLWSRYYRIHMTKRCHALIISLIVLIALFILDGFLLSLGIREKDTNEIQCYYSFNLNLMVFYQTVYPWIHFVVMYIIPFLIMIIGIILIIIKLYNHRLSTRFSHQKRRSCIMLIAMCIVYMILTLPNRLCFSIFYSRLLNHSYTDTILLGSNALLYTRNATNIIFLYLSSTTFRKQLTKFYCCLNCQRQHRIVPIQQIQY